MNNVKLLFASNRMQQAEPYWASNAFSKKKYPSIINLTFIERISWTNPTSPKRNYTDFCWQNVQGLIINERRTMSALAVLIFWWDTGRLSALLFQSCFYGFRTCLCVCVSGDSSTILQKEQGVIHNILLCFLSDYRDLKTFFVNLPQLQCYFFFN